MQCSGEPVVVAICHCTDCQRRTGSAFGVGAFFLRERVSPSQGASVQFRRLCDSGSAITFHFCGHCGSTVWWEPDRMPSMAGVAVGAFSDPAFPAPTLATWAKNQHRWVQLPEDVTVSAEAVMRPVPP